jgi:hypothetical protein
VSDRSQVLVRRAFLAGVGLVYLIAFASLWVQVEGLIGGRGILPAAAYLGGIAGRFAAERYVLLPTVLWWVPPTDTALDVLCGAGVALSLLLMTGCAPVLSAVLCWVGYLSLFGVSRAFLGFQWDILLLEMGFLAIFYAPLGAWSPRSAAWSLPPPRPMTWLLRLLLFKVMFSSGVVKLSSGDPTWWNLTALSFHYETTCLPTWTGWYMYQLPLWAHRICVLPMFATELVVPFFVFGPRPLRLLAAAAFTGLMIFIGATGNYGFFNVQSVVLCLPLLDDDVLPARWRAGLRRVLIREEAPRRPRDWPGWVTAPLAVLLTLLTLIPLAGAFRVAFPWPEPLATLYAWQEPFHLVNGYGLFARMTTERPEILLEGSDDGKTWRPYEFRWKPGDVERRPRFVEPHMPRLDWRMWFAALGSAPREGWFYPFCLRLLEGSKPVLDLLATDPFPDRPPKYVRAQLYDYRFTRLGDAEDPKAWWKRRLLRPYTPVLTLTPDGRLGSVAIH